MKWVIAAVFLFMGIKVFAPDLLPPELGGGPLPVKAVSVNDDAAATSQGLGSGDEAAPVEEAAAAPTGEEGWPEATGEDASGTQEAEAWGEDASQQPAEEGWQDEGSWDESGADPYSEQDGGEPTDDWGRSVEDGG